jgi:hypothetical protein
MSSKSIYIIDIIKSSETNVEVQSIETYAQVLTADDFGDDDQINKRAAVQLSGGVVTEVPVIPAGESIPFFLDASLYSGSSELSEVITKTQREDPVTGSPTGRLQRFYDMDVVDQDTNGDGTGDFTGWDIYGHDDGTGNFKYDTYVILKG